LAFFLHLKLLKFHWLELLKHSCACNSGLIGTRTRSLAAIMLLHICNWSCLWNPLILCLCYCSYGTSHKWSLHIPYNHLYVCAASWWCNNLVTSFVHSSPRMLLHVCSWSQMVTTHAIWPFVYLYVCAASWWCNIL